MASFTLKVKKGHFQTPKTTITLQIKKHKIKLKSILTNRKIHGTVFLLIPFSNIKKSILTNLKIPIFILIIIVIIILKETIYIKPLYKQFP